MTRVQLRRTAGWRKPVGSVVITRTGRFGNPFTVAEHGRDEAVRLYREHLAGNPELLALIRSELGGKVLCCSCPLDELCHGDVILAVLRNSWWPR